MPGPGAQAGPGGAARGGGEPPGDWRPRLDLISPADLGDAQRAVYQAITGGPRASQAGTVPVTDEAGRLVGPFAVMLLAPGVGGALQQVGAQLRFGTGLTARQRELGTLAVAGTLRCAFERLAHEPAAMAAGLSRAQLDAVLSGRVPDGLAADEALVARLALAMAASRDLTDEDYAAGLTGLGAERLAELTWLVGYYAALALALAVFRPFLPESFTARGGPEPGAEPGAGPGTGAGPGDGPG